MIDSLEHSAPESLQGLKTLLQEIQAGNAEISLGSRALQTLASLVDQPHMSAVSSITELAEKLNINASTLTRLAKRLGYRGFNDLQSVFRNHVAGVDASYYSRQMDQLIHPDMTEHSAQSVFLQVVDDELANLRTLAASVDPVTFNEAATMLKQARKVRVHGLRQFYSLANFFSYGLGLIRNRVSILGEAGHGVAHALSQLNQEDVLVVLGCNPYTRATLDASRVAQKSGIPVIALTDSSASPLAATSSCCFIIPSTGRFYANSTAAWATLLEGLLTLVARELGDQAIATLKTREALFKELGISL